MPAHPEQFVPSPDDAEFVGRFQDFRWRSVGLAMGLTVVGLLLLGRSVGPAQPEPGRPDDLAGIEALLDRALADPAQERLILLGDSVLRGSVMQAHGIDEWERWTVAERMRAQLTRDADVAIFDLSLDGMLPADMAAIMTRLDERDPEGRIGVVLELSARYLSSAYAQDESAYSREFLRPAATADDQSAEQPLKERLALTEHRLGLTPLRDQLPETLRNPGLVLQSSKQPGESGAPTEGQAALLQRALHRGRVAPHFLETDESPGSAQVRALAELGASLARSGRRALAFNTPLDEAYLLPGEDPTPLLDASAPLRRMLAAGEGSGARFLDLNDGLFEPRHFLDHCHLTPEGNGLLARRLLQALALPLEQPPSPWEAAHELTAPTAYVLGDLALGRRDGVSTQVRFGARKRIAQVRPGVLFVSDTDNGCLRVVHVGSRTCETLFDGREAGQSVLHGAEFEPGPIQPDGAGGAYFLDLHSGQLGHLDARGELSVVGDFESPPWYAARRKALLGVNGSRVIVTDGERGIPYVFDTAAEELVALGEMPLLVDARSLAIEPNGRIWVLDAEGALHSFFPVAAPNPRLWARANPERARAFWERLIEDYGIEHKAGSILSMNDPSEVHVSEGHVFLADHYGDFHTIWRFLPKDRRAWPLLTPGSDGLSILGPYARLVKQGSWAASGGRELFWISEVDSTLYRFNEPLFGRSSWKFGKFPASLSPGAWTINGYSYGTRKEGHYRLGVFGSSIAGAGYVEGASLHKDAPGEVATTRPTPAVLVTTNSMPFALGRALRGLLGENPHELDVLDFTLTRASLVNQLVSLVALDPLELDMALFTIDRGSIDVRMGVEVPGLAAQWRRLAREENGLPKIGETNGFVAIPVWEPESGDHEDDLAADLRALRDCLSEILAWCEFHGIRAGLVDMRALDDLTGAGFPQWQSQDEAVSRVIEEVLGERPVPWIQVGPHMLTKSASGHPFSNEREHHLTAFGHAASSSLVAYRLRPLIESDLSQFDELLGRRRASAGTRVVPRPAQLIGAQALSPERAAELGIVPNKTQLFRIAKQLSVVAEWAEVEAEPWRAGLAALGLAAAERARQGDQVSIRLVRYANHDEYGEGVAEGVQELGRYEIKAEQLERALAELEGSLSASEAPAWLGQD